MAVHSIYFFVLPSDRSPILVLDFEITINPIPDFFKRQQDYLVTTTIKGNTGPTHSKSESFCRYTIPLPYGEIQVTPYSFSQLLRSFVVATTHEALN